MLWMFVKGEKNGIVGAADCYNLAMSTLPIGEAALWRKSVVRYGIVVAIVMVIDLRHYSIVNNSIALKYIELIY